jgi:NADPH:quinone reductase-like Zn-dependent oxidoreductase
MIDYTTQNITQTLSSNASSNQKYDLIVDCVGGKELLSSYEQLLHPKGTYITIVGDKTNVRWLSGPITYLWSPAQVLRYLKGYIWGPRYAYVSFVTNSSCLEAVVRLAERGEVRLLCRRLFRACSMRERGGE